MFFTTGATPKHTREKEKGPLLPHPEGLNSLDDAVATVLALEESARSHRIRALADADASLSGALTLLQDYASAGDDFEDAEKADALLDGLGDHQGIKLHGRRSLRAFHLMVDLGVWSRYENLWLHRYKVNTSFQPPMLQAAEEIRDSHWEPAPWRKDLTRLTTFSIDDAWTSDIDDAISCQPRIDGGWDVGIHIADPSARIPDGSAIDLEARTRGTSIYLPTGTIPMLPRALSEDTLSLNLGVTRPAMSTLVHIDRDLNVVDVKVVPSMISVKHRLDYDQVDAILDGEQRSPLEMILQDLSFLASEFFHQRLNDGATDFNIPDPKIQVEIDERNQPEVSVQVLDMQSPARTLVSEIMILASSHMARFCYRNRIPVIYRSQEAPDGDLFDDEIQSFPEGLPRTFAMLRRMKSGSITTYPEPHFGLGVPMYVQATSPLRRYTDLICQRQVKAFLAEEELPYDAETILQIAAMAENTSREAGRIERETRRYWTLYYLATRQGEALDAMILDWRDDSTAFVFIEEVAFRHRCSFRHHVPIGENVRVIIERADPRSDQLRLREA